MLVLMLNEEEVAVDGEESAEETKVGSEVEVETKLLEKVVEIPEPVSGTSCRGTVSTNPQDVIEFSILKGVETEVVDNKDVSGCTEDCYWQR